MRASACGALAWVLLQAAAPAAAQETLRLRTGHQHVISSDAPIERVAVGNPEIADVQLVDDADLLVTGKAAGETSLHFWSEGRRRELAIQVERGPGTQERDAQVQIDIRIVEVNRRSLKQAGVNLIKNSGDQVFAISPPGVLSGISTPGAEGFVLESASGFVAIAQAFNLVYGDAGEGILAALSVLEAKGLARVVAEPSLVAMSGQTATFLAGGEFPIPVVQGTGNGSSVTVEFKPFGIRLMVTPTVIAQDRIVLKVAPEVSQLDFTAAVASGGVSVPGLITRRADTTIELGDGERFVIGGLVDHQWTGNLDKVPLLGDIPLLGALFKAHRFRRDDRELLMVVSPRLVRPLARSEADPALPGAEYDDYDPTSGELLFQERGQFDPDPTWGFAP
jgi:pilus assembly protein CpaC